MASSDRGADGEDLQETEKTSGKLSGSPKLTFAQDAGGDTIARSEGTWDTDDGFAIGQKITISGALNAGDFSITNITNGGRTLVLDASNTVNEISTKALSIAGAVDAPVENSPTDDSPTDDSQIEDSTIEDSAIEDSTIEDSTINSDGDTGVNGAISDASAEESPAETPDSRELSWLFADSPEEDSPEEDSPIKDSPIKDAPINSDRDTDVNGAISDAPAEGSPDESAHSRELSWLFADAPAEDSAIEHSPITSDDVSDAGRPLADAPAATSPTDGDDDGEASRRSTHAPGRAIRSSSEVEKLLLSIRDEGLAVTAYPEDGELLFASRLLAVAPDLGRLIVEYSQWKPANSALLDCAQVLFHCERKNRHIQFLARAPAETVFAGSAGIQVGFPQFILDLQQRTDRRFRIASGPSMWCVIKQEGSDPIVANVDDISRGGLGGIVHDPGVVLKPGMIFRDCQITGSELKRPIDVSVEIRYWKTIRSPQGVLSKRVGCRFVASSAELQQLMDVFIADLDDDESQS